MESNFERAFNFAMEWETWRSDDPRDPGGLTIWGISSKAHAQTVAKIKNLPEKDALEFARGFYYALYWATLQCDKIPAPIDIVAFDTAILCGTGIALLFLKETHDWKDYLFLKLDYLTKLDKINNPFIEGWVERTVAIWKLARGL